MTLKAQKLSPFEMSAHSGYNIAVWKILMP